MVSCATLTYSLSWLTSMYAELHSWCNRKCRGGSRGGRTRRPPLKLKKIRFVWRKIVIFHTKYLKILAPPSTIGKNMIFWRKIVIFHTKYPKMFAPPSARCNFLSAPLPLTWNPGSAPEMSAVVHQDKLYNWYLLFSAAHAALLHKNKNLLASYQENASEWASHNTKTVVST